MKDNEEEGIMQADLIRLLQKKHNLSSWVARERIRDLYTPFYAKDGGIVMPMLVKQLTILGNRPQTILRLQNDWKKLTDSKVRDFLSDLISPALSISHR